MKKQRFDVEIKQLGNHYPIRLKGQWAWDETFNRGPHCSVGCTDDEAKLLFEAGTPQNGIVAAAFTVEYVDGTRIFEQLQ